MDKPTDFRATKNYLLSCTQTYMQLRVSNVCLLTVGGRVKKAVRSYIELFGLKTVLWAKWPWVQVPAKWRQPSSSTGRQKSILYCCGKWVFVLLFASSSSIFISSVSEEKKNDFSFVPSLIYRICVSIIYFHILDCSTLRECCRGTWVHLALLQPFGHCCHMLGACRQPNWCS